MFNWSQSDSGSVSRPVDDLPERCGRLIAQQRLCDSLNSVAVSLTEHVVAFDKSCQPSISLCQLSAMSIRPTHLFGFCMLTSVDKMFIRFIFAKDMQLHYIWYYKILIKTCSCYDCEHLYVLVWARDQLSLQIRLDELSSAAEECHHFTLLSFTC